MAKFNRQVKKRPLICNKCGSKAFKTPQLLNMHKKKCKKSHKCHYCHRKMFSDLKTHLKRCKKAQQAKQQCKICDKRFFKQNFKGHLSTCKASKLIITFKQCSKKCAYKQLLCNSCMATYFQCRYTNRTHSCFLIEPSRLKKLNSPIFKSQTKLKQTKQNLLQAKFKRRPNNFEQFFRINKLQFIKNNRFSSFIPDLIEINKQMKSCSKKDSIIISEHIQNSNFLGLKICKINSQKGFGIVTTTFFKKNSLIAIYNGFVTLVSRLPANSSDLFTLFPVLNGRIHDQLTILPLRQCCGYARFINGVKSGQKPNCKPLITFFEKNQQYEPILLIQAIQDIQKGTQITYDYGEKYWQGTIFQEDRQFTLDWIEVN